MDEIRISSWSDLLLFAGEVEFLKELCAQRDDSHMPGLVRSSVGKARRRGGFFEKGGCDCRYCSDEW